MVYHKCWLCSYCCPIIDMFMTENMSKHFDQLVNLKILNADCPINFLDHCHVLRYFRYMYEFYERSKVNPICTYRMGRYKLKIDFKYKHVN